MHLSGTPQAPSHAIWKQYHRSQLEDSAQVGVPSWKWGLMGVPRTTPRHKSKSPSEHLFKLTHGVEGWRVFQRGDGDWCPLGLRQAQEPCLGGAVSLTNPTHQRGIYRVGEGAPAWAPETWELAQDPACLDLRGTRGRRRCQLRFSKRQTLRQD